VRPRRTTIVLGLAFAALVAYFLAAHGGIWPGVTARAPARSIHQRPLELDAIDRREVARAPQPVVDEAPESSPDSRAATPQVIDVSVLVLSRRSRAPQANLPVTLAIWPQDRGVAVRGLTNVLGSVTLRLERADSLGGARCSVTVGLGGPAQVFSGLPLRDRLVVLVEDCVNLHGRVRAQELGAELRATVQLDEPARGAMLTSVMLGRAHVGQDGAFELPVCPTRPIPWVDVRVQLGSIGVIRRVSWNDLASEGGADIEVTFTELVIRVLDDTVTPLAGADVRVAFVVGGDRFPAVGTTDARGEYRATLEPGDVEVIASLPGFASAVERVRLTSESSVSPVILRLRPLTEVDRVRGRVVREDGTAIEQALVTAAPALASADAAMAGAVQRRTGADGRFDVSIAGGREIDVTAYRRDLGISDTLRFFADGREVELVIRPQGSLEVRVEPPRGMEGFAGGRAEYVLVDRRYERSQHGHAFAVPFQVEELPAGDYNVFVFVGSFNSYAEGSVRVEPERTATLDLASREAQCARGAVRGAAHGLRLTLEHPTWPPEVENIWSASLDHQGGFELLLGDLTSCPALLKVGGGPTRRVDLRSGDGNNLSITP
jgi:hypothetical protein